MIEFTGILLIIRTILMVIRNLLIFMLKFINIIQSYGNKRNNCKTEDETVKWDKYSFNKLHIHEVINGKLLIHIISIIMAPIVISIITTTCSYRSFFMISASMIRLGKYYMYVTVSSNATFMDLAFIGNIFN